MFTSVRTPRVYEHIVGQIEHAIYDGRIASGDRLPPERELVRQFGASRVAVREALRTLEHRGLVEVRHGSSGGHFVRHVDTALLRRDFATLLRLGRVSPWQLAEARLAIEPPVAGLAAQRAAEVDLRALGAALESRREVGGAADPRALDLAFHRLVAAAAKNPVHAVLVAALMDLEADLGVPPTPRGPEDQAAIGAAHREVFEAIAARNPERARAAMEAHIADAQRRLRRAEVEARPKAASAGA
jgi:GntR family transcriptional repressor for pyruvate dehydrogenase complex